jgi:surface antigen
MLYPLSYGRPPPRGDRSRIADRSGGPEIGRLATPPGPAGAYHTSHTSLVNYNSVFRKNYSHQSQECTRVTPVTAPHFRKSSLRAASVALLTTALVGTGAPALAAGKHLCDGYRQCAEKGMTASGYAGVNDRMYWRMYSGHNCTNYAAYRMIKRGLPNTRPWSGGGNAVYWGTYMARITDNTPRVGSIAWWDDYNPGHVAYVERVISANEIIISQDSWGGDFSWARVTRDDRWPSGFIHFNDKPLANRSAPRTGGVPKVGGAVTATSGRWSPSPSSLTYRWFVDGRLLPRAKQPTVKLTSWMVGKRLRLTVVARRLGYPATSVSKIVTEEILPGTITSPATPRLSGRAQVDRALRISSGTWSPQPVRLSYQWLVDGERVPGATSPRFGLAARHAGKKVTGTVTARRNGYAPVTRKVTTGPVQLGVMQSVRSSTLSGRPVRGETLRVRPGAVDRQATAKVQWLRDGRPIPGATGTAYELKRRDVARRVRARVTFTRPGYRAVAERVGGRLVKGKVRLVTTKKRVRNGIVFDVVAQVAGQRLADPTPIVVRWNGQVQARGVLENGRTRLRVTGLPRGQRVLWFRVARSPISVVKVVPRRAWFR